MIVWKTCVQAKIDDGQTDSYVRLPTLWLDDIEAKQLNV